MFNLVGQFSLTKRNPQYLSKDEILEIGLYTALTFYILYSQYIDRSRDIVVTHPFKIGAKHK